MARNEMINIIDCGCGWLCPNLWPFETMVRNQCNKPTDGDYIGYLCHQNYRLENDSQLIRWRRRQVPLCTISIRCLTKENGNITIQSSSNELWPLWLTNILSHIIYRDGSKCNWDIELNHNRHKLYTIGQHTQLWSYNVRQWMKDKIKTEIGTKGSN